MEQYDPLEKKMSACDYDGDAANMFIQLAVAGREKPLKKAAELEFNLKYPIYKITRPDTKFGNASLMIESKDFNYFLPSTDNGDNVVKIGKLMDYTFINDKLSNGLFTAKVSFYDRNGIKLM